MHLSLVVDPGRAMLFVPSTLLCSTNIQSVALVSFCCNSPHPQAVGGQLLSPNAGSHSWMYNLNSHCRNAFLINCYFSHCNFVKLDVQVWVDTCTV